MTDDDLSKARVISRECPGEIQLVAYIRRELRKCVAEIDRLRAQRDELLAACWEQIAMFKSEYPNAETDYSQRLRAAIQRATPEETR